MIGNDAPTLKKSHKNSPEVDLWKSDDDFDTKPPSRIRRKRGIRDKLDTRTGTTSSLKKSDVDGKTKTKKSVRNRRGRKIETEGESSHRNHRPSLDGLELNHSSDTDDDDDDDGDDESISRLEKQMKPTFDNPKWLGELKPFHLSRQDDSGEKDYIPASINRYLKDYQQEGVQFLHSVVTRGLGGVLGDDMGKFLWTLDRIEALLFLHFVLTVYFLCYAYLLDDRIGQNWYVGDQAMVSSCCLLLYIL